MLLTHEMLKKSGFDFGYLEDNYSFDSGECHLFQEQYGQGSRITKEGSRVIKDADGLHGLSSGSLRYFISLTEPGPWQDALQELEECRQRLAANGFTCAYTCCHLPYTGSLEWPPRAQDLAVDLVVFASPRMMLEGFTQSPFIISGRFPGYGFFDEADFMLYAFRQTFCVIPFWSSPSWVKEWMLSEEEVKDEYIAPQAVFVLRHRGRGWHGPGGVVDRRKKLRTPDPQLCKEMKVGHARLHYDYGNPSNQNRIGLYLGDEPVYSPDWYAFGTVGKIGRANNYSIGSKIGHR